MAVTPFRVGTLIQCGARGKGVGGGGQAGGRLPTNETAAEFFRPRLGNLREICYGIAFADSNPGLASRMIRGLGELPRFDSSLPEPRVLQGK